MTGRILAVDPGEKRIGLAISDELGVIANPCGVVKHIARAVDAAAIALIARERNAVRIIVGCPYGAEGEVGPQARKSVRMLEALREQIDLPVELWDEYGSTELARSARFAMGARRAKREGHMDDLAATVILQSYLDAQETSPR
jgi:putative holliday junction resolvase